MPSMNRVSLIGNLTRDPDVRKLPSGSSVCTCRLAINESYTDRDGNKVDHPCFVDIDLWEKLADTASRYLRKGSLILVEGRLQYEGWKTEDGQARSRLKIRGDRIQFLDRAPAGEDRPEPDAAEPSPAQAQRPAARRPSHEPTSRARAIANHR